jgi:NAD-dependent deacetylase
MPEEIGRLAQLIVESRKVIAFTGAGISTESGIPDFRSPGGIWSRYDPEDFTIQKFLSSPESRKRIWRMAVEGGLLSEAEPNGAHYAIAELHRLGKLDCVITQNIDHLHQKAGVPEDRVFELHGNMQWVICLDCHRHFPMPEVLERIRGGMEVPDCPDCHGILKPAAVFFGEALPEGTLRESISHARGCDLLIAIGSTLIVYPAAYIPTYARDAGAKLAIINLTRTPFDYYAEVVVRGKAAAMMADVMGKVRLVQGQRSG